MKITRREKLKPIDKIKIECGFGCQIIIKTVDKYTNEEKAKIAWPTIDAHNLIVHKMIVDETIYPDDTRN